MASEPRCDATIKVVRAFARAVELERFELADALSEALLQMNDPDERRDVDGHADE